MDGVESRPISPGDESVTSGPAGSDCRPEPATPTGRMADPAESAAGYVKIFDVSADDDAAVDPACPPPCPMVEKVCERPYDQFRRTTTSDSSAPPPAGKDVDGPVVSTDEQLIGEIVELEAGFVASFTTQVIFPDEFSDADDSDDNTLDREAGDVNSGVAATSGSESDSGSEPDESDVPTTDGRPAELSDRFADLSCVEGFCNIPPPKRRRRPTMPVKRTHRESLGNMSDITDAELENDDENAATGARRLRRRILRSAIGRHIISIEISPAPAVSACDVDRDRDGDDGGQSDRRADTGGVSLSGRAGGLGGTAGGAGVLGPDASRPRSEVLYNGDRVRRYLPDGVEDPVSPLARRRREVPT